MNEGQSNPFQILALAAALLCVCLAGNSHAQSLETLERIAGQATSFEDFISRPKLVTQYKRALIDYMGRDKFPCESFEDILANIQELSTSVPGFSSRIWQANPSTNSFVVTPGTAADVSTPKTQYEFIPLERRFHALWIDPSKKGCTTTSCSNALVTSPDRWVMGLEGSVGYFLHKNKRFDGSAFFILPLKDTKNKKFGLVTHTGSEVVESNYYQVQDTNKKYYGSLEELFVSKVESLYPGQLVKVSYGEDDARIPLIIKAKRSPAHDNLIGLLEDFYPGDPIANQIYQTLPRKCFGSSARGGLNLFAGFLPIAPGPSINGVPSEQNTASNGATGTANGQDDVASSTLGTAATGSPASSFGESLAKRHQPIESTLGKPNLSAPSTLIEPVIPQPPTTLSNNSGSASPGKSNIKAKVTPKGPKSPSRGLASKSNSKSPAPSRSSSPKQSQLGSKPSSNAGASKQGLQNLANQVFKNNTPNSDPRLNDLVDEVMQSPDPFRTVQDILNTGPCADWMSPRCIEFLDRYNQKQAEDCPSCREQAPKEESK